MSEASARTRDPRLVAVVRAIMTDVERRVAPGIVEARGVERLEAIIEGDDLPAERIRRENARALLEMEAISNKRKAASEVAKNWTRDPHRRTILDDGWGSLLTPSQPAAGRSN
jgi:hypothetical protein